MSNATIEDRFNAFCGYVHDVTGRPVLKARRGMNFQFSEPYISVDLLSCNLVPKDVVFYEDNKPGDFVAPLKATVRGLVYAVFQITSLGGADAVQIMHKLHTSFKTDSAFRSHDLIKILNSVRKQDTLYLCIGSGGDLIYHA